MAKNTEVRKRYDTFVKAFCAANPNLIRATQLEKAQDLWRDVKNDTQKQNAMIAEFKSKTAKNRGKFVQYWTNLSINPPPPPKVAKVKEELKEPVPSTSKEIGAKEITPSKTGKPRHAQEKLQNEIHTLKSQLELKTKMRSSGLGDVKEKDILELKSQIMTKEAKLRYLKQNALAHQGQREKKKIVMKELMETNEEAAAVLKKARLYIRLAVLASLNVCIKS